MYAAGDEAAVRELDRLYRDEGVTASCSSGCSHCCRFNIQVNMAEAHALVQHIRRVFSADQIDRLRTRTRRWHEWDNSRPGRPATAEMMTQSQVAELSDYDPVCPLLENSLCIAYAVRPMVCRTHFVSTHPLLCRAASDPSSTEDLPVVLSTVVAAAAPFAAAIRENIEAEGLEFSRTIMLLPHWLAVTMDWEFAVEF